MAIGIYLVVIVSANQHGIDKNYQNIKSGTGGYTLFFTTKIPVKKNLNQQDIRNEYGLELAHYGKIQFIPMRVKEGDDASCLNLNQVNQPQIIGIDPKIFAKREAFQLRQDAHKSVSRRRKADKRDGYR